MKKIIILSTSILKLFGCAPKTNEVESTPSVAPTLESEATSSANVELVTGPTVDSVTSASIVQKEYIQDYTPAGFTDSDAEKALFIIGDPRHNSVLWDEARTAMKHLE